jgi:hypothetical protein
LAPAVAATQQCLKPAASAILRDIYLLIVVQSGVEKTDRFPHVRHSRNWVLAPPTRAQRDPCRQNLLVGRCESRTLSEAGEAVGAMHRLASRGHPRPDTHPIGSTTKQVGVQIRGICLDTSSESPHIPIAYSVTVTPIDGTISLSAEAVRQHTPPSATTSQTQTKSRSQADTTGCDRAAIVRSALLTFDHKPGYK